MTYEYGNPGDGEGMMKIALMSKQGGKEQNEDFVSEISVDGMWMFALADGLGGVRGGAEAAKLAVCAAEQEFRKHPEITKECLCACFEAGQKTLMRRQQEQFSGKTTLCLMLLGGKNSIWGHVGDSRIYRFSERSFRERTQDHSVPQMLAAMGEITEEQIRGHEDRSRLLRAMGVQWKHPQYEVRNEIYTLQEGDAFLLCTDGFWEWVLEKKMETALSETQSPEEWLYKMEQIIVENSKDSFMDDYSAIAVIL